MRLAPGLVMLLHLRAGFMFGLALSPFLAAVVRSGDASSVIASDPPIASVEPKEPVVVLSLNEPNAFSPDELSNLGADPSQNR